jgi:hypothetical protein
VNANDIKAMLGAGMTPREIHERSQADHRETIKAEIAAGKWRCPGCGQPMKLKPGKQTILFCGGEH